MRTIRVRESKIKDFMAKRGYKDAYDMKDRLLAEGYTLQVVKDKTAKDKTALVWWWIKKVMAVIMAAIFYPVYGLLRIAFAAISIVRGIVLFLMLEPERSARCFLHPFNPKLQ